MKLWNKIRLWWKFEGRYYKRNFIDGVKNLYYWFPIIWKTRAWDYGFTYDMLEFKLKETSNYISKKRRFVGWEFVTRDIKICIELIKKLREDFYSSEYTDYLESEFEFIPVENEPELSRMKVTTIEDNLDIYFNKYPRLYEKYAHLNDRERIAIWISRDVHVKARKLLFKIIEEKIESWWD